jgi:hypothetical protein
VLWSDSYEWNYLLVFCSIAGRQSTGMRLTNKDRVQVRVAQSHQQRSCNRDTLHIGVDGTARSVETIYLQIGTSPSWGGLAQGKKT